MNYSKSEHIVIVNGSNVLKAGFANTNKPSVVLSTVLGSTRN